jgi:hypothetical protein
MEDTIKVNLSEEGTSTGRIQLNQDMAERELLQTL